MVSRNQKMTKSVLTFAALAMVFLVLAAASANAAIVAEEQFIYEPIQANIDGLNGGIGFDGPWVSTISHGRIYWIHSPGLSFSTLPVAGNALSRYGASGRAEAHRLLSAASQSALTRNGMTIWFSVLFQEPASQYKHGSFLFGTDGFTTDETPTLSAAGDGFGFTIQAAPDGSSQGTGTINALAFYGSTAPIVVQGTFTPTPIDAPVLIVGKINWKADGTADELFLFNVTDLSSEPPESAAIASITNLDFSQSAFETIAMWDSNNSITDEIRFGTTFGDVMGVPFDPKLPTVLAGSSRVTWSGEPVTLDPNVVNNDEDPQRNLSYAWAASPSDGVVFTPNDGGDGSSSSALAPSVTITKAGNTGDATEITLTLTVTLEGEDPVVDAMAVYVYDDSCEASKGIGSVVIGAGDFNGSCFTDLEDFAVLAADWLFDYAVAWAAGVEGDSMTIDPYETPCEAALAVGMGAVHPADIDGNCITDSADLLMFAGMWLDGNVLAAPIVVSVTVPSVTDASESAAQSILTGLGLATSSTYQCDEVVPSDHVITQHPRAGSQVADGGNVSLVVSNGPCPVSETTIAAVYLAQTHVLRPNDPLLKLVGNRPTLLKVQVIGPYGTAAPAVTAVVQVGGESTTLTLDGPATLPTTFEAALGKVEHRYDDSFTTLIPPEWIRPGLNIRVTAGNSTVDHDIKVGAPTVVKMKMFDVHYFGLGSSDYPAGTFDELEAKWPVSSLDIERIRDIDFPELVIPARSGAPNVRVTSKQDYKDQTDLNFDGEQAAALQWVHALSASGGNFDVAMQYINIIGVSAGGQAGGFDGVGGISLGILNHELGHALSLPHWGDNSSYPYKGTMYGIDPQPGVYMGTHTGPTWAFDLPSMTFIPPTVQENSVGGVVGCYKKSPMQGGGSGDQEQGFFFRHFSDFAVARMQSYLEGKVAVFSDGKHYKWDDEDGDYTRIVTSNGVRYPIEHDVQVISVMASTTLSDRNVNMVYPPIGPYEGNLILTFDPTDASDRALADDIFCPSGGCDFSLRVIRAP